MNNQSKFYKNLKLFKNFVVAEFSPGRILFALMIAFLALLGPIIQLSERDVSEMQFEKLSMLMAPHMKDISKISGISQISFTKDNADVGIKWLIDNFDTLKQLPNFPKEITLDTLDHFTKASISFLSIAQVFTTAILYALAWGISSALKNKNESDRNRVLFMNYNKNNVVLFKMLTETLMFITILLVSDITGMIFIKTVGGGSVSVGLIERWMLQTFSMSVFFFFIQFGIRFIIANIHSKKWKGVGISIWLLTTVFLYIILAIVLGLKRNLSEVIVVNEFVFAFVPIVNIVSLPLVLYGMLPMWTLIPYMFYLIIPMIILWKRMTRTTKEFLCS